MRRSAKLLRDFRAITIRRRMPPERARPLRHALKQGGRCRAHGLVQWQLCMHFRQGLAAWAEESRSSSPVDRHGVTLVPVAQKRESSLLCPFHEPRIALRQCDGAPSFAYFPLQAQAGERLFHPMDDSERAAIIGCERRRVDNEGEGLAFGHRLHPVTTTFSVKSASISASLCAWVLTPMTKSYPHAAAAVRSPCICSNSLSISRLRMKSGYVSNRWVLISHSTRAPTCRASKRSPSTKTSMPG